MHGSFSKWVFICCIFFQLNNNIYTQTPLTLPELLSSRFDPVVMSCGSEECAPRDCTELEGCNTTVQANQLAQIINEQDQIVNDVSNIREVPCDPNDPTVTELQTILDITKVNLPITLSRIRICGGVEYYLFRTYLENIQDPYEVVQQIDITSYDQLFEITIEGQSQEVDLETLLHMIFYTDDWEDDDIISDDYIACGEEQCTSTYIECTNQELGEQEDMIDYIRTLSGSIDLYNLSYPMDLYYVALCGGKTLWVLKHEWDDVLHTSNAQILETVILTAPDDPINSSSPCHGSAYEDDITVITTHPTCEESASGSILINVSDDAVGILAEFSIDGGETYQSSPLFQNLEDGGYFIVAANENQSIVVRLEEIVTLQNPCLENDRETCSDGIDNDGDGLVDCDDEGCQVDPDCNPGIYCDLLEAIDVQKDKVNEYVSSFDFSDVEELNMTFSNGEMLTTENMVDLIDEFLLVRDNISVSLPELNQIEEDTVFLDIRSWKKQPLKWEQRSILPISLVGDVQIEKQYVLKSNTTNQGATPPISSCPVLNLIPEPCSFSVQASACLIDNKTTLDVNVFSNSDDSYLIIISTRLRILGNDIDLPSGIRLVQSGHHAFDLSGPGPFILSVSGPTCVIEQIIHPQPADQLEFDLIEGQCIPLSSLEPAFSCFGEFQESCLGWTPNSGAYINGNEFCPIAQGEYTVAYTIDGVEMASIIVVVTYQDVDGDGLKNDIDPDVDGDGLDNSVDDDDDGDGIPDSEDPTPLGV